VDYGIPRRNRPRLKTASYEDLKSGRVELNGREVPTSSLSSFYMAREVARTLQHWIERGDFLLTEAVEPLSRKGSARPMKQTKEMPKVEDVMSREVITVGEQIGLEEAARIIVNGDFDHLPVVSPDGKLMGIITAWDISKAVASGNVSKIREIMTRRVYSARPDEPIELAARTLDIHSISALPVVDKENRVLGMITSNHISRLLARRR
jgi:CBS domain-containing protein